jgi:DNA-binding SARP family transcriptional activator
MEATRLPQNGSSLFAHALSRLLPEIFTHPIWEYFGEKQKTVSGEVLENLQKAAKQIQGGDPDSACQVLLACAALQNDAGHRDEAIRSIQKVLSFAERTGLDQEIIWASWGACAICVQAGDYEQAARYLQFLQTTLQSQNDWILADYIEMVGQYLVHTSSAGAAEGLGPPLELPPTGLMRLTFDWLYQWGFPDQSAIRKFQPSRYAVPETNATRFSSTGSQRWQKYWKTIKQVTKGELRLKWVANDPAFRAEESPPLSLQTLHRDHSWAKSLIVPPPLEKSYPRASLLVYCLGPFRVYQDEQPVEDWPSSKGKAVFKYLVTHREHPVVKDVLMDLFWSGISAESARNNLNVAIYGLRQALRKTNPSYSHVLFIDDCYLLNPELHIWLDYEAFLRIIADARKLEERGDFEATIHAYNKAETLYQGEFLPEDRYEDWLLPLRENLQAEYLSLLDRLNFYFFEKQDYQACIHLCRKMLTIDPCNEEAHRHLMRCFFERGQAYMALRQYYLCVEALKQGLNVAPASTTKALYEHIHRHS